jgi:hypothetical protein
VSPGDSCIIRWLISGWKPQPVTKHSMYKSLKRPTLSKAPVVPPCV